MEIKKGQKCRVISDSVNFFRAGEIVVTLEDVMTFTGSAYYVVSIFDYIPGNNNKEDYYNKNRGILCVSELEPVLCAYSDNIVDVQQTLEEMKKQFLPPVRKMLDFAIENIEENKRYKELERIMQETLSADAVSLLKDPEEFKKWLERGIWNARKCDELARELDALKESIEACPRGFAAIPDYANIGDVFKTRDSEYLLVLSDGNLVPIIESSAPLLRTQLDNLGDSVELRNHEGIIVDYRYGRNQ